MLINLLVSEMMQHTKQTYVHPSGQHCTHRVSSALRKMKEHLRDLTTGVGEPQLDPSALLSLHCCNPEIQLKLITMTSYRWRISRHRNIKAYMHEAGDTFESTENIRGAKGSCCNPTMKVEVGNWGRGYKQRAGAAQSVNQKEPMVLSISAL